MVKIQLCVFVIWNDEWEVHKWHLNVLLLSSQILILVRVWYFQVSKLDKRSKTSNVLNVSPCISNSIYVLSDNVKCQQQVWTKLQPFRNKGEHQMCFVIVSIPTNVDIMIWKYIKEFLTNQIRSVISSNLYNW